MKISMIKQITMLAAAVVAVSCVSNDVPIDTHVGSGEGKFVLSGMGVSEDLREMPTRADGVDCSDFNVCIYNTDTNTECYDGSYAAVASPMTLPVGNYSISVQSHEVQDAAWEDIHYSVSDTFVIEKDQTTTMDDLVCRVSNILVSVTFSDKMKALMADGCKVDIKVGSCGPLSYGADETRKGCFKSENDEGNSLVWEFTGTIDGEYYNDFGFILNAKPGEHRTLHFDVETIPDPERGDVEFIFQVSVECTTYNVNLNVEVAKETVVQPLDSTVKIEPTAGYSLTAVNTLKKSESLDGADQPTVNPGMAVTADKGIAAFTVQITTDNAALGGMLAGMGLDAPFNLVSPGELETVLGGFGFPTGDQVLGKTNVTLSLSGILPVLFGFGNTNKFDVQIWVRDAQGTLLSKTLRLKLVDDSAPAESVTITGDGIDQRMMIHQADAETTQVIVDIEAPEGISTFLVGISSTNTAFNEIIGLIGFGGEGFDLANPTPEEEESLRNDLGLPCGDEVRGQTSMRFDISSFVPLLFLYIGDGDFNADFMLTVTDSKGGSDSKTVKLALLAQ